MSHLVIPLLVMHDPLWCLTLLSHMMVPISERVAIVLVVRDGHSLDKVEGLAKHDRLLHVRDDSLVGRFGGGGAMAGHDRRRYTLLAIKVAHVVYVLRLGVWNDDL